MIICEGAVTEVCYINDLARSHRNPMVTIEPIGNGGGPREVLHKMESKLDELKREARKDKTGFAQYFEIWGIADVDNHHKVEEARNLAKAKKLNLTISNPCFELWGILHFSLLDGVRNQRELQRELTTHMPEYHHEKNPRFEFSKMHNLYETARKNAQTINQNREKENNNDGNPSTNVFLLFDVIVNA